MIFSFLLALMLVVPLLNFHLIQFLNLMLYPLRQQRPMLHQMSLQTLAGAQMLLVVQVLALMLQLLLSIQVPQPKGIPRRQQ